MTSGPESRESLRTLRGMNGYFNRIRVPLIFCVLSAFRNPGNILSINSKYDESGGVFCVS
jgi:hypothetical protein